MFETHYNHKVIRNYTVVMASIFKDLKVDKGDGTLIKIPMSVANSDKTRVRVNEHSELDSIHIKLTAPRLSLEFVGLALDPTRKTNPLAKMRLPPNNNGDMDYQLNRSPYRFSYRVYVRTKTIDQMMQVIEQVCANLDPYVDINVNDNEEMGFETAIRVKLMGLNFEDNWDGDLLEDRYIESNFDLELEGWLYKKGATTAIIKTVNIDFKTINGLEIIETLSVSADD